MKAYLICQTCNLNIGTLEKPIINQYDIDSYDGTVTCDCGGACILVIQPEE